MIICAAIKLTYMEWEQKECEMIICGHRHRNCYDTIEHLSKNIKKIKMVEGFINHNGVFLNREEAFLHAGDCGQLSRHTEWYRDDNDIPNELYSEDLY